MTVQISDKFKLPKTERTQLSKIQTHFNAKKPLKVDFLLDFRHLSRFQKLSEIRTGCILNGDKLSEIQTSLHFRHSLYYRFEEIDNL